jgi:hypothetical protein
LTIEGVHLELGVADEQAGPGEGLFVVLVIAGHVADVLTQEALDALVELLHSPNVNLFHAVGPVSLAFLGLEWRHPVGHLVVERGS